MDEIKKLLPDGYEVVWSRRPLVPSDIDACVLLGLQQIADAFRIPAEIIGRIGARQKRN